MIQLILLTASLGADPHAPQPPQLSEQQLAQIRILIRETKSMDTRIKGQLVRRQRELTSVYQAFELDGKRIEKLQLEIVDLQKQLLDNYHRLQTGLRKIAGRERFKIIKARVDLYLRSKDGPNESADPSGSKAADRQDRSR